MPIRAPKVDWSKLLNYQLCSICLEHMKWFKIKKLMCGHKFHSNCIKMIYKPQCPLCEHPIFNEYEKELLQCRNVSRIKELLQNYLTETQFKNIYFHIKSRLESKSSTTSNYLQVLELAYKYCDFTHILANNLTDETLVTELIQNSQINWHKTFNGKSFFELVIEKTNNLSTINLILDKLPKQNIEHDNMDIHYLYPRLLPFCPSAPYE